MVVLLCLLWTFCLTGPAFGADWPTFKADAARSGCSDEELPGPLHLQWTLELPAPRPAWPSSDKKLQFDRLYEPILLGKTLIVPSMIADKVTAHEIEEGGELWTFRTDGPVRLAPAGWKDRVFVASDDGWLYAIEASGGRLLWKFRGGPSDRKVLGQGRLIGMWPVRGAPVVRDGTVYFAAGIWPFMGIFIHALDAETGRVEWTNDGTGSRWTTQQHTSPAFAGAAPQGYLAATEDLLVVAGGRTVPAVLDRRTGRLIHFDPSSREMGINGGGGYEVIAGGDWYLNRGFLYRLSDGRYLAPADASVLAGDSLLGVKDGKLRAYAAGWSETETTDRRGKTEKKVAVDVRWDADVGEKLARVFIVSGRRAYAAGESGTILAIDLPRGEEKARVSWRARPSDEPLHMIAGGGRLFVSTDQGRIYCFGGEDRGRTLPHDELATLVPMGARWRYLDGGKAPASGWREEGFDDAEWPEGPAQLGYGEGDEATVLDFGGDEEEKAVAYHFRRSFEAPAEYDQALLWLHVDDGAVVHLNGVEVARLHMPAGEAGPHSRATTTVGNGETVQRTLRGSVLRRGANVLAVSVHQVNGTSSDLSFDLELRASERWDAGDAAVGYLSVEDVEADAEVDVEEPEIATLPAEAGKAAPAGSDLAAEILRETGADGGTCLALGAGRLAEEIAMGSSLHVVVLEPDAAEVDAFRVRLDAPGIYGSRIAVLPGTILDADLPPYMAELVVAEEPARWGWGTDRTEELARRAFHALRPHTGAACLVLDEATHDALVRSVSGRPLDGGVVERRGRFTLIRRVAPPAGSGTWTHQYGDAANTVSSRDTLVKAPLGLLWFGGPSNEAILPRHGHGPTPQVVGGRLFIEGRDLIRAIDIYSGRLLWEKRIRGVGMFYDYTTHEPGANALGSNYVSLEDGVWVAHGPTILRLDPRTGETLARFYTPEGSGGTGPLEWGYIGAWEGLLVGGMGPSGFVDTDFTAAELAGLKDEEVRKVLDAVPRWRGFEPAPRGETKDREHLLENLNKLLLDPRMVDRIPEEVRKAAGARDLEKRLASSVGPDAAPVAEDLDARITKRTLLSRYYGLPRAKIPAPGTTLSLRRTGSSAIACMERATGDVLWRVAARNVFRHNAIALGGGKVFSIDRLPAQESSFYRRRGLRTEEEATIHAFDIRTGAEIWSEASGIFGTWLGYSEELDILLEAGSSARDRMPDEVGRGMTAYRGSTGEILWKNDLAYGGPPMILGDRTITQVQGDGGFALDLRTGRRIVRPHPISGEEVPWRYTRNYGCNTAIAAPHILTFRSAAAGYYDLRGDGGTGNFGGFRSGCTSNLIPAGGVICAPDYTRTCTCAYQNQVSLALVPMPEVEVWTFQALPAMGRPVERLGLNFGAPGDRLGPDGTLWLDCPSGGGPSPDPKVEIALEGLAIVTRHPTAIREGDLAWVGSSAVFGTGEIAVRLRPEKEPTQKGGGAATELPEQPGTPETPGMPGAYTVRLVFAEIEGLAPGERVFDVALQGETRLEQLDIASETGGANRTLIREFRDVAPLEGFLRIGLRGSTARPPLLCGVQVVAQAAPRGP